jgi:cell division protein ZapA (FtsZ GTPase activity inhibitor)
MAMPEIEVMIGDRLFTLACDPGQEASVRAAAARLDEDARTIGEQVYQGAMSLTHCAGPPPAPPPRLGHQS